MKSWHRSGLPVSVVFAMLALLGLALSAYATYRHVFNELNATLDQRIMRAAEEGHRVVLATLVSREDGAAVPAETAATLQSQLRLIRRTAQLESLFAFDLDRKSLADARPSIRPGRKYGLLSLSSGPFDEVRQGQTFIDNALSVESHRFRNAAVPLMVDGTVVGGVYAQASLDFEQQVLSLRRHWQIATAVSVLVSAAIFVAMLLVLTRMNAIERQMSKQSRLSIISLLTAGISHDIKNPLSSIVAAGDLLERRLSDNADALKMLGYIRDGADRIMELTQNLLMGGRTDRAQQIELKSMVDALVKQMRPVALEKHIKITEDVPEGLTGWGAAGAFRMALANIVKNALEAVPDDTGRIEVGGVIEETRIGLTVRDNGPGIPANMRRKIFDPMVSTKEQGSGIGLAVTRQILEDMQGALVFESGPGNGATFTLWLPISE